MNSWTQTQQTQSNMMGQASFNPYLGQRAPYYRADPIHGENAAWQFPISGGEIYLPDADEDIIWWIKVDQNGAKQVVPFDVKPHKKPEPVDLNQILDRLNNLEDKVNAKFNKSNAKRSIPTEPIAVDIATTTQS